MDPSKSAAAALMRLVAHRLVALGSKWYKLGKWAEDAPCLKTVLGTDHVEAMLVARDNQQRAVIGEAYSLLKAAEILTGLYWSEEDLDRALPERQFDVQLKLPEFLSTLAFIPIDEAHKYWIFCHDGKAAWDLHDATADH